MTEAPLPGRPVDCPLPPEFCEAMDYRGAARFVAFRWAFDDLTVEDGRSSATGAGWTFSAYTRHRAVWPLLADLTPDDGTVSGFALVVDREKGRASIARLNEAAAFLDAQWPPLAPPSPEEAEAARLTLEELLDPAAWRVEPVDMEAVQRAMDEQRGRVRRMVSWLDMAPDAEQRGRG